MNWISCDSFCCQKNLSELITVTFQLKQKIKSLYYVPNFRIFFCVFLEIRICISFYFGTNQMTFLSNIHYFIASALCLYQYFELLQNREIFKRKTKLMCTNDLYSSLDTLSILSLLYGFLEIFFFCWNLSLLFLTIE